MTRNKSFLMSAMLLLLFISCEQEHDIYKRQDWLAGKVYTQILAQPELSTFATCIELTGYDEILDVSGSYTVFSPSNEAFDLYFSQSNKYNSVEDIPIADLTEIVKYHILQNPWSKEQLRSLDVYGWNDELSKDNNKPRGFKRETLLLNPNRKYGIDQVGKGQDAKVIIVDTLNTNNYRYVSTDSRKYAPVFYQEYFDIHKLNSIDYEFYFGRPFEGGDNIFFAGAKIISEDISAENGFIYIVDRVVEPLKNASEIIENSEKNDYTDFLELLNRFPLFEYNREKTFQQTGADEGLVVDSLFDLSFPSLAFDFSSEKTSPPSGTYGLPPNVTIRYHHGLMAPTNAAFQTFINEFIAIPSGWGSFKNTPENIKKIIANTYLSVNTIYPSDFKQGFYNGELDLIKLDEAAITEKKFGSNSTFIGLNQAIVPRAFNSVTGPVYLQRGYSKVMNAIEQTGLLPALKRENENYMFFVENDANTSKDSSLIYYPATKQFSTFLTSPKGYQELSLNLNDLRTLLLNQIAIDNPTGIPRKEFIPNLAGNIIIINNITGEVSGTAPTTKGHKGTEVEPEFPVLLSNATDNGTTYSVQNWFSFSSPSLFVKISTDYPKFHGLLKKAGLTNDNTYKYTFISDNDFYTVFIPGNEALNSAGVDSMPIDELRNFLLFHFVQGEMIFTDGKKQPGYYETARIDEKSTQYTTIFTSVFIEPGVDIITLPANDGSNYLAIEEAHATTNIITGVSGGTGSEVYPIIFNNGAIHEVDKVLKVEELEIR